MATVAEVTTVMAEAAERVVTLTNKLESYSQNATNAALGWENFRHYQSQIPGLRGAPPQYQANTDLSYELRSSYADALQDLRPEFMRGVADFIARWYPECVVTHTDNWICNTILTGGTGLPPGIEDAIWERARRRELLDGQRLEQEATEQMAARGFSLPPGVLSARLLQVQRDIADKSSTIARDAAIKHIELIVENVKFAVEQGVKLRLAVLAAINDYIRAWMTPETLAIERAKALTEAKTRIADSSAAYYNAMIAEAELSLKAQDIESRSWDRTNELFGASARSTRELRANTSKDVAAAYGQAASAAASSIVGVAQNTLSAIANG